jgi:pimeloyl-ACP methyl ester carboxylesterase
MDNGEPSFVDTLAAHHRVIVLDNAGTGETSALTAPLTITKMAVQTSAFITTLHLRGPAVLGWSMGGMIAQTLAVLYPWQVSRPCSRTYAGRGRNAGQVRPVANDYLLARSIPGARLVLYPDAGHGFLFVSGMERYVASGVQSGRRHAELALEHGIAVHRAPASNGPGRR